jgi:hypothetical protein
MGKQVYPELPTSLLAKLKGAQLYRAGDLSLPVITLDEAGWPNVAMAPGAVAARADQLWTALGTESQSVQNLIRDPHLTILVAAHNALFYVKGLATVVRPMSVIPQETAIMVAITEVSEDIKPFLTITSGIGYQFNVMRTDYVSVIGMLLNELQALAEVE